MTDRQLIAYAIVLLFVAGVIVALWRRSRRLRRDSGPHLRINLLDADPGEAERKA